MDRRSVLRRIGGVVVGCCAWTGILSLPARRYGYIDIALAKRREYLPATVYLDGVDISNDCFELDDKEGYASVFVRDATGNHYLVDNEVAKATRYGTVVFVPRHDPT